MSPDTMRDDRLFAFILGCIPAQSCPTSAGWHRRLPDLLAARQGVGVRACTWQTRGNRESWTLQQDRWYRREIWALHPPPITAGLRSAEYVGELQTHLLCNAFFFFPPPQDLPQQNWSGNVSFSNAELASALLPSMKSNTWANIPQLFTISQRKSDRLELI